MDIHHAGSRPTRRAPTEYFTGTVCRIPSSPPRLRRGLSRPAYPSSRARAHWHTHPLGQTLYVIAGVGRIQTQGEPVREIRPGDVVWISPGEKHWHGGSPTNGMVHIAMQESLDGNYATWMEQVTDAEYSAKSA